MGKAIDFGTMTLRDALDLAMLIEEEARDRYTELAAVVAGTPETAAFFTRMARVEDVHCAALLKRRRTSFGDDPPDVARDMISEVEAPSRGEVRPGMTPREALKVVLRAEEKAAAYFASATAQVKDVQVRALFESLRREETGHQQLVKDEMARLRA